MWNYYWEIISSKTATLTSKNFGQQNFGRYFMKFRTISSGISDE